MKRYELLQTGVVVGICAYILYAIRQQVLPNIAGFVDGVAGTLIRPLVVPPGPNALAVEYWSQHGLDQAWFMEIATGAQEIPNFLRLMLPDNVTVGMLYNGIKNWSEGTTVGDLENWSKIGLPGSSDELIGNMHQYADAVLWRVDTIELIYNQLIEDDLWDVIL